MTSRCSSVCTMAASRAVLLVYFSVLLSSVFGNSDNDVERGLNILIKTYKHCESSGEMVPCLKIKALKLADRALKIQNIPLFEGVTVIRSDDAGRHFGAPEFNEKALPLNPDEKDETLDDLLVDRVSRFFKTHSLQFSLPKILGTSKEDSEEGRGKMKKYMGPLIMAAMVKGGFFVYAMKMVGLLAVKALFVSKIALVLAAVIGLKKLFSSGGGAESKTIEIVQKPQISHTHAYSGHDFGGQGWESSGQGGSSGGGVGGGGGGGYGRSFDSSLPYTAYTAQDLAYGKRPLGEDVGNAS